MKLSLRNVVFKPSCFSQTRSTQNTAASLYVLYSCRCPVSGSNNTYYTLLLNAAQITFLSCSSWQEDYRWLQRELLFFNAYSIRHTACFVKYLYYLIHYLYVRQ